MIFSEQMLINGMSDNGSWSSEQLACLGIKRRFNKGWKHQLIGKDISREDILRFYELKNYHLIKRARNIVLTPEPQLF